MNNNQEPDFERLLATMKKAGGGRESPFAKAYFILLDELEIVSA